MAQLVFKRLSKCLTQLSQDPSLVAAAARGTAARRDISAVVSTMLVAGIDQTQSDLHVELSDEEVTWLKTGLEAEWETIMCEGTGTVALGALRPSLLSLLSYTSRYICM